MDEPDRPLSPLTPRQQELIRFIQGLDPTKRYVLTIVCRGREPWEVETAVERRKLGELKPRTGSSSEG